MTIDERARALFFALEREENNDGQVLAIRATLDAVVEGCARVVEQERRRYVGLKWKQAQDALGTAEEKIRALKGAR